MYYDEFIDDLHRIMAAVETDDESDERAMGRINALIDDFAVRFTSRDDVVWSACRHMRRVPAEFHCAARLADALALTLPQRDIPRRLREDEQARHDHLEETAAKLLAALEPVEAATGINGPCFIMLAQEVLASGVEPMALTLADVSLMLGKARVRYNRMEKRLAEIKAEG